jgi:hypothetical protein
VAVDRNKKSAQDTVLYATASQDALRFRRAQKILAANNIAVSMQLRL